MPLNNGWNARATNNSDGGQVGMGTTSRLLKWLGSNVTFTGTTASGSLVHTFPNYTCALVGCLFTQTADKTVSNTVTETSLIGTGVATGGGFTIAPNTLAAGTTLRLKIGGVYTTPLAASPSLIVKVKFASTVIATVTTTALLTGATNLEFSGEVYITCRSTGGSGTVMTHGDVQYAIGTAGTSAWDPLNNAGATTTVDTTSSSLVDVTVQWDTATSTRSVKSTVCTLEVLN